MSSIRISRLGVAALAVFGIAFVAFVLLHGRGDELEPGVPTATVVTAAAVRGSLSAVASAYGTVAPSPGHTRIIVMPHDGTIESVDVRAGSAVRGGQPIVTIAVAPAAAAQYTQARSAVDLAKTEFARVERLRADRLATNDQVEMARKALADAQAQLDQQTATGSGVARDVLRAPFDGVVTLLAATPGDRPQVGAAIATLSSRSDIVAELGLEPADAAQLTPGTAVRLTVPQDGFETTGALLAVAAAVDPTSRLVNAAVQIPADDAAHVALGMTLVARVDLPARDGVVVPRGALLEDADGQYLFTVVGGKAHRQAVRVSVETDDAVLIDNGLEAGASVVVAGNAALEDGVAVVQAKP